MKIPLDIALKISMKIPCVKTQKELKYENAHNSRAIQDRDKPFGRKMHHGP